MIGKLTRELGRETVVLLAGAAGGRLVSVPRIYAGADSKLAKTLGPTLAIVMIDNFPGERIYIPMHPSVVQRKAGEIKTEAVAELRRKGMSATDIAAHLQTTVRTVRHHLAKCGQTKKPRENRA